MPDVLVKLNRRLQTLKGEREQQRARSQEGGTLDNLLLHVQAKKDEAIDSLLLHIGAIFDNKPELDQVTLSIMASSAADQVEEITALYSTAYGQAQRWARLYRVALYVLGLALVGVLGMVFFRLQRASRALEYAHQDLRERYDALQRAQSELALFARLFNSAREGMMITDAQQHIIAVNASFVAITGYGDEQVLGQTPKILSSGKQDEAFYRAMWADLNREGRWQGEIWNRRQNGEPYPEWLSVTVVRNELGEVVNYVGIFSDISERKSAEARIHHLAHYDALTNLPNRALLQD
ncbi:MAG: PAS domain S-box protein, partial [Rhodocyclaceae bacterium]|nr:PAS domain S-box protein [Rhodocyclaceae bacterium]